MGFYKPDEDELRTASWEALRVHIRACHAEIDRTLAILKAAQDRSFVLENDLRDLCQSVYGARPCKTTENGIETWHNLPVLVPVGLIPEERTPCEVRSLSLPFPYQWIGSGNQVNQPANATPSWNSDLRILLADKPAVDPPPTWVPWPWLNDGEYRVTAVSIYGCGISMNMDYAAKLKGHTSRPDNGRWQVTNGTATYMGEA